MPIVTVWLKPSELPIASTTSPTSSVSERPSADLGQVGQVDLEQRELGIRVRADELGHGDSAIGQLHANLVGAADDVPVRDDVALRDR